MTDFYKEPLKGTTTVGLVFKDGVILAADKRASMGFFIAGKGVDKIHPISDRMALTLAGSVGDAQTLVRVMRAELQLYHHNKGAPLSVKGAATLLSNILQGNKYFPYFVQLIVAGYDEQPQLFDLDPLGGLIQENYVSTGSGSVTAYGYLDANYKENLSEADAVKIATKAVHAAMKRDAATGEGIDAVVITAEGVKRLPMQAASGLLSS
ncbi:archaeal proteasome endopeptidase complex subunit beta [Candidatus Micrarchaeota archaeon]|nr:archaeal proteasome endopeptidase complex subunit beta [Candidatus Micrarchaeota archaeon]